MLPRVANQDESVLRLSFRGRGLSFRFAGTLSPVQVEKQIGPDMRLISLDVLRGVAVLLVLIRHMGSSQSNLGLIGFLDWLAESPIELAYLPALVLRGLHRCGWMGVDLFFVLSGFLVSGLLFREYQRHGDIWVGRFLIRRGFKIYPAFYVFLALSLTAITLMTSRPFRWYPVLSEMLFVQNYGPNLWGHTWSLAVEEHFYLLLGGVVFLLSSTRRPNPFKMLPAIYLTVVVIELSLRLYTAISIPEFTYKTHIFPTHLRIDSLFLGVLVSYFYHFEPERFARMQSARWPILAASVLVIAPSLVVPQSDFYMHTVGLTLLSFGFAGILVFSLPHEKTHHQPGWLTSGFAIIGLNSYSIYLWHFPVLVVGVPVAARLAGRELGAGGEAAVYGLGSIGVGIVMAKLVEWPVLRLRDRWFPSRSGQLKVTTTVPEAPAEIPESEVVK
jgi:peptidoglycan/LPS O-acetylase OafA/YrhL